jgi:enoyl-CoA hydratase/carnithine racemase
MSVVEVDRTRQGVVTITLNRPDRLNAMNQEMVGALIEALEESGRDPECRVVVLTGAGRGFCSGIDLQQYAAASTLKMNQTDPNPIAILERQRSIARLAVTLHELRQPVIAAINGPAAGLGLALVCASDIRMATRPAVFAVSFIRAGYSACDIGLSWLLPRIVGAGRAHELMLTGRKFEAQEALTLGLVTEVVDTPQELLERAYAKADEIMLNPPFSVELTKQGMWLALETPSFSGAMELENRQQVLTALTKDRAEATMAFLEKRAPHYERR